MTNRSIQSPGYYAVLPASIRYDSNLTHMQKLLYAEINAMANEDGYCAARNKYFSDVFGNSERTVSRAITGLEQSGYITIEQEDVNGARKIYVIDNPVVISQGRDSVNPPTKMSRGVDKNGTGDVGINNNTKSINTNNTPNNSKRETVVSSADTLPTWLGKSPTARLIRLYDLVWQDKYGLPSMTTMRSKEGNVVSRLVKQYGELMVGMMIIVHFEWRGASGTDEFQFKKLYEKCFPLTWISPNADAYRAYIHNTLKITDPAEMKRHVEKVADRVSKTE